MCNCDEGAVCARHRGTRHDPAYHDEQNDVLGFDPYNDQPESDRPAEYEVSER